jgi:cell division protein FtsW (lipid II flippase)
MKPLGKIYGFLSCAAAWLLMLAGMFVHEAFIGIEKEPEDFYLLVFFILSLFLMSIAWAKLWFDFTIKEIQTKGFLRLLITILFAAFFAFNLHAAIKSSLDRPLYVLLVIVSVLSLFGLWYRFENIAIPHNQKMKSDY